MYKIENTWNLYQEKINQGYNMDDIKLKDTDVTFGNYYKIVLYNKSKIYIILYF